MDAAPAARLPADAAANAPGPKTPDEIELAEWDRELAGAIREIRSRNVSPRERIAQLREFHRLNAKLFAGRDALVRKIMAASASSPAAPATVAVAPRGPRTPVPGETPDAAEFRDAEFAFAAAVDAIRKSGTGPADRHQRMARLLELNREFLAEQEAHRARFFTPSLTDALPEYVPRDPAADETPKEAEFRRIDDALGREILASRRALRGGADAPDPHRRFLEENDALLERKDELLKELTEIALDRTPASPDPEPAQPLIRETHDQTTEEP